jgi:hypothetical protein
MASGAVLAVALGGLTLVPQSAVADAPPPGTCVFTPDVQAQTMTLTADCDTFETLDVPDGYTLLGGGHTITAVQDVDHPSFHGAVVQSATGDSTAAATMNVENLTITSRGFGEFTQDQSDFPLRGIAMVHAGGSITDVTVDGIAHAEGGQRSRAIYVDNTGGSTPPEAVVSLDRVTVERWQKAGVDFRGNVAFDAQHLTVGDSENVDGTRNTVNAPNGVVILDGAHGSVTDSTIGENRWPGDDGGPAEDVVVATSILVQDAGSTTLARNVIKGEDGDVAVMVADYNDDSSTPAQITVSCSTLVRTDGGHADANAGYGIWNYEENTPNAIDLTVASTTFSGWRKNIQGAATTDTDDSCGTSNQVTASASRVVYGETVLLSGQARKADGSAATGTAVLQRREGDGPWTSMTDTDTTTNGRYSFRVLPKVRTSYRARFSGDTVTDSTSRAVVVGVTPRIGVRVDDSVVKRLTLVTLTGSVAPGQAGRPVILQQLMNGKWTEVRRMPLTSSSGFSFGYRAPKITGTRQLRLLTPGTDDLAQGVSRTVSIRISR